MADQNVLLQHVAGQTLEDAVAGRAVEQNVACRGALVLAICQNVEQSGFARPRWTHDCQRLSWLDHAENIVQNALWSCVVLADEPEHLVLDGRVLLDLFRVQYNSSK